MSEKRRVKVILTRDDIRQYIGLDDSVEVIWMNSHFDPNFVEVVLEGDLEEPYQYTGDEYAEVPVVPITSIWRQVRTRS